MPYTRRQTIGLIVAASSVAAFPQRSMAREAKWFQADGLAIRGTDPVAYATKGAPVPGNSAYVLDWGGTTWRFSGVAERQAFMDAPGTYAPQFGGYCAYAASRGYLAPTIPEAWTIYENQLFLNASLRARTLWLQDVPGNIAKGRANWPDILG